MEGFFQSSEVQSENSRVSLIPKCGACGLFRKSKVPKLPVSGEGSKSILLVGSAPDHTNGKHFSSGVREYLQTVFRKFNIDLDEDCWHTNALICGTFLPPASAKIGFCRPNAVKAIEERKPTLVLMLGPAAVRSVVGHYMKEAIGEFSIWEGFCIPLQAENCWLIPLYHPQYLLDKARPPKASTVPRILFERRLEYVFRNCLKRPWKTVPDYRSMVRILYDPKETVQALDRIRTTAKRIAFDYENNMLKPDSQEGWIASASVCYDGVESIAFPFSDKRVRAAFKRLLRSPIPKVAANLKHEDRWSNSQHLGTAINNWDWDTMLAGHHIRNTPGAAGLEFQSFVCLGFPPWDQRVSKFFESEGSSGYGENRIREVSFDDLLLYNGLDSLLEFILWKIQTKGGHE